jgi:putative glutamine amidotransferase
LRNRIGLAALVVVTLSQFFCAATADAQSSPRQALVAAVPGLGPLLLVDSERRGALSRYGAGLLRRDVFGEARPALEQWTEARKSKPGRPQPLARLRQGPVIGIQLNAAEDITGTKERKTGRRAIARAIRAAGGQPVFLPPAYEAKAIPTLLRSIDHLVIAGGADLDPSLYGQAKTHAVGTNLKRDLYEQRLIRSALRRKLGIDGICRGEQSLNVATGGTLFQDLTKDGVANGKGHRDSEWGVVTHAVNLAPDSHTARAIGACTLTMPSSHHQAVDRLGHGLRVVGRAPDGVVELIEGYAGRVRGYQFHPELSRSATSRQVFRDIVRRAGAHRAARENKRPQVR